MAWVTGQASQNLRFIFVSLEKNWRTNDTPAERKYVMPTSYEFKEIFRRIDVFFTKTPL